MQLSRPIFSLSWSHAQEEHCICQLNLLVHSLEAIFFQKHCTFATRPTIEFSGHQITGIGIDFTAWQHACTSDAKQPPAGIAILPSMTTSALHTHSAQHGADHMRHQATRRQPAGAPGTQTVEGSRSGDKGAGCCWRAPPGSWGTAPRPGWTSCTAAPATQPPLAPHHQSQHSVPTLPMLQPLCKAA